MQRFVAQRLEILDESRLSSTFRNDVDVVREAAGTMNGQGQSADHCPVGLLGVQMARNDL